MKVLLIVLGVLFLIGCIPVGVWFRYQGEIQLKVVVAFLKLTLLPKKPLPRKKREKAEAKKAAKAAKKAEAKEQNKKKQQAQSLIAKPPAPPKPKEPLTEKVAALLPWARLGAGFVGEFFHRKLTVRRLRIRAVLAGGDPAKTARSVGTAWEIIGVALPILERAFRIKERRVAVYPDFQAKDTDLEAELYLRLRVGGLVLLALKYGFKAVKLLIAGKLAKKRKKKETEAESTPESNIEAKGGMNNE